MRFKGIYAAVAAVSLASASTMAAAAPVAHAPVAAKAVQPASETVQGDSALRGGGVFIGVIAAIIVIIGVIIVAREDSKPKSP